MFKVNSEKELLRLLKVISEESVKKSKKMLNESSDSAQSRYMKSLDASENLYGKLSEQEATAPAEDKAPAEAEPPAEETPETEETQETEETEKINPEELGVSFDSVVKDINTLRSGRSTKDKEIKDELLGYYDKLDDAERKLLHLFLGEISKILQGALEAADAQDPSDSPFNAEITFGEEEQEAELSQEVPSKKAEPSPVPDAEDTSPPIKVNERQELNEIRRKVQRLMKRF